MSTGLLPIQTQAFLVYGNGVVIGNTTLILSSFKDIDGNNIAMQGTVMTGTIEPNSGSSEEQIIFTGVTQNANGTATLTGVSSVAFASPYTQTSGFVKSHAGNTTFVLSDTAYLYSQYVGAGTTNTFTGTNTFNIAPFIPTVSSSATTQAASIGYVNNVAIAGGAKASSTVFGISELSIDPTTASVPIAIGVNNTNSGTVISVSNNVEDVADTATTSASLKLVRAKSDGSIDSSFLTGSILSSGFITMYGGSSAPTGWVLCDGSSLLRAGTYASLFGVIGTSYGSADGTHFNVPDLRGRVPLGVGTGTGGGASGTGLPTGGNALTAVSLGTWKGEETHVLTTGELASHSHSITAYNASNNGSTVVKGSDGSGSSGSVGSASTGSDTAHNNIQPVMGVNFVIKI